MNKAKSSAVLIALLSGAILAMVLTLSALSSQSTIGQVLKDNNSQIARSAALGGIEDGLLRYKKAVSGNSEEELFTKKPVTRKLDLKSGKASYDVRVKMDSISYGEDFSKSDWLDSADKAKVQKALLLEDGDKLHVDLTYLFNSVSQKNKPTKIEIKFSNLFKSRNNKLEREGDGSAFATISYQLIDKSNNDRIISRGEAKSSEDHQITVSSLENCSMSNSKCLLEIGCSISKDGDLVFVKTQAKSSSGIISPSQDPPGTLIIESVGNYKGTKFVATAKYNYLGGDYLGIFYPYDKVENTK